jgi:hypothetical protein
MAQSMTPTPRSKRASCYAFGREENIPAWLQLGGSCERLLLMWITRLPHEGLDEVRPVKYPQLSTWLATDAMGSVLGMQLREGVCIVVG